MRSKDDFDLTIKCINTIKNTVDPDSTYILISDDHSPYKEGSEFLSSLVGEGRGVTLVYVLRLPMKWTLY
jgi:hypothetical protein